MIGLTGFASHLPAGRMTAAEIAEYSGLPEWVVRDKLGISQKILPGPADQPTSMAVAAAEQALSHAGLRADTVDVVICITEEHKEYPVWTAGIKLAYDLGADKAYAYDLGQKCGSAVLALKQAKDLIIADDSVNTVLIAGGYRNSDLIDLRDPAVRFMYNLGAGAAAAVIERQAQQHELLASAVLTDGGFSLDVIVPVGGTMTPLSSDNLQDYRLTVPDPEGMKERLESKSLTNFAEVVKRAVEKSGYALSDIAYLAMLHVKPSAHRYLLQTLGLSEDQSVYLSDYGHIGQVDQLLSLELAQAQGKLKDGDLVVLVAAGVGYVWNAICLRWGPS